MPPPFRRPPTDERGCHYHHLRPFPTLGRLYSLDCETLKSESTCQSYVFSTYLEVTNHGSAWWLLRPTRTNPGHGLHQEGRGKESPGIHTATATTIATARQNAPTQSANAHTMNISVSGWSEVRGPSSAEKKQDHATYGRYRGGPGAHWAIARWRA